MITVGIDLASQAINSAASEVKWSDGTALVSKPVHPLSDGQLLDLVSHASMIGIDVPFGWPASLVNALVSRGTGNTWVHSQPEELLFRSTDLWVKEHTRQQPLSVAGDKIAWPAVRAARLFRALAERGIEVDRSGSRGRVVEVYPAAALRQWGLPFAGYKRAKNLAALGKLADRLFEREWLRFTEGTRDLYRSSDDCFDALIASLVARAHACQLCESMPEDQRELARIEGWIAIPHSDALDHLAAPHCSLA